MRKNIIHKEPSWRMISQYPREHFCITDRSDSSDFSETREICIPESREMTTIKNPAVSGEVYDKSRNDSINLELASRPSMAQDFATTKNSASPRNLEDLTTEEKPGPPSCYHYTPAKNRVNSELGIFLSRGGGGNRTPETQMVSRVSYHSTPTVCVL